MSADADLAYRALLQHGPRTGPLLARELGMRRARIKSAVDELAAAGVAQVGDRTRWMVCSPDVALAMLRRRRLGASDPWWRARRYLSVAAELELPEHPEKPGLAVRRLDNAQIRGRIAELVALEKHEHLAMQPEEVFSADAVAAALPLDRALMARGVRMRVLGRPPADGDASSQTSDQLAALGGEYREATDVPVKTMVFDRRVALLPAGPGPGEGVLEIGDAQLVSAVITLFTREWSRAIDPQHAGIPRIILTLRQRSIVELLASGLTDDQVAEQLSLSARTIAYAIRGLMDQLGVENRFQLGLVLGAAAAAPIPGESEGTD